MEKKWMEIDDLRVFRGKDIKIADYITIHQPSLEEIYEYGERDYFSMIHSLTAVGADLKWQLDDLGIDYTEITDFELFYKILVPNYPRSRTEIIFGELDFTKFKLKINPENGEVCMYLYMMDLDGLKPVVIDEFTYLLIIENLRKMHGLTRNNQKPANNNTKMILIEDARDEYMMTKDKEYSSFLLNYVSTMVNCEGFKYNHENVWGLKIYAFLDSVKRISKIKNAELLLQSGYSGYGIDLKNIDKKQLDWSGEL
jgi:hypothetical protein